MKLHCEIVHPVRPVELVVAAIVAFVMLTTMLLAIGFALSKVLAAEEIATEERIATRYVEERLAVVLETAWSERRRVLLTPSHDGTRPQQW